MDGKTFLAFDLGASSGRAILGKLEDGKLTLTEVHRFANGPVEQAGSLYWNFGQLCKELKTGLTKALAAAPELSGIGVDTWGVDYVLFRNGTDQAIRMPYNYRDERCARGVALARQKISQSDLYRRTGVQFMQLNTIYQLMAHQEQHPEDLEGTYFLTMPDALSNFLSGDRTSEYTECSTSNLLDPEKRDWDFELIDTLGLPRSIFPKIVPPCSCNAVLRESLQQELGCGPIPVFKVGSHDTASAVCAVPAPAEGNWAYVSCGTWALLGAEIARPLRTEAAEKASFTNEGGLFGRIRFLTNIMGSWLIQETRRNWNEQGRNVSFADMEKLALSAGEFQYFINPNDDTFLAPCDMPRHIRNYIERTGQASGSSVSDAEVMRAIYDSLSFYFARKLATLESVLGTKYSCLNMVGGGIKDSLLMQLTANAAGIDVLAGPVEATATGNILAQALAAGVLCSDVEARDVVRHSFEVKSYRPQGEAATIAAARSRFEAVLDR